MERLQKILANFGIASRRKAEEFISEGRVKINGRVAKLGDKCDENIDEILLDDTPIKVENKRVYYLLNKPKGYISTAKDERGRKTVLDLAPKEFRIYPVGRLDCDTEGLLILTNDGELTNALIHPSFEIEKTYIAKVAGNLTADKLKLLQKGIMLEDGMTAPAKVKVLEKGQDFKVEITIHEGRNREIRRMFAAVSCKVKALKRIRFANITLEKLDEGKYRELTDKEVEGLYALAKKNNDNRRGPCGNDGGDNGGKGGG